MRSMFGIYVPLPDLLDWRSGLTKLSHREAFDELRELTRATKIEAVGTRRIVTSAPFAGPITWTDNEETVDLREIYPFLNENGRATGSMYLVESGPAVSPVITNVVVEVSGLYESWRALIDGRRIANAPPAPEQQNVETGAAGAAPIGTIAQERRCGEWLNDLMKVNSSPVKNKDSYQSEALCQFGISIRGFHRAWMAAILETGNKNWSKPGRKS